MSDNQLMAIVEAKNMAATIVDMGTLIVRSPDICGDHPRIAGTRITVGRIAILWKQGLTPEEIADNWGYLSMAQVYAALTYYRANREEIEQSLKCDREDYDHLYAYVMRTKS